MCLVTYILKENIIPLLSHITVNHIPADNGNASRPVWDFKVVSICYCMGDFSFPSLKNKFRLCLIISTYPCPSKVYSGNLSSISSCSSNISCFDLVNLFCFLFMVRPHCVTQTNFELANLLSQLPKCWDCKHVSPCLTQVYLLKLISSVTWFVSCCYDLRP